MNFHHDLAEIARKNLKELGIVSSADWDDYMTYLKWLQIRQRRLNSSIHYQVRYSDELLQKLDHLPESDQNSVLDIERHLRNAEPITGYMSKSINSTSMKKSDFLLKVWNIYHVHLERKSEKKYLNPNLLFFQRMKNTIYFIDVRQHPVGNQWFSRELLGIVYDNWPELIHYIPGMKTVLESGEPINLTDEQVFELMKNGITIFVPFRDGAILYTSGGIAASGDGGIAVWIANNVWNRLAQYQLMFSRNQLTVCKKPNEELYRNGDYKLIYEDGRFLAYNKCPEKRIYLFKEPEI